MERWTVVIGDEAVRWARKGDRARVRVVLDTSVLVPGPLRSGSPADLRRQAWEDERLGLVTAEWQLDELGRVTR